MLLALPPSMINYVTNTMRMLDLHFFFHFITQPIGVAGAIELDYRLVLRNPDTHNGDGGSFQARDLLPGASSLAIDSR